MADGASYYELVKAFDCASGDACSEWVFGRPTLIIKRDYAVYRFNSVKGSSRGVKENLLNNSKGKKEYNGTISPATAKKITTMLDGWLSSVIKFKDQQVSKQLYSKRLPVFMTLTMPSSLKVDHNWAKRELLMRFILKLKEFQGVKYYFWRAELQRNGQIHFHLIVDHFINRIWVQKEWNSLVWSKIAHELPIERTDYLKMPSTHLKGVNDVKNFIQYVIKYATKNEGYGKVSGRLWGCSDELRAVKKFEIDYTPKIDRIFQFYVAKANVKVDKKTGVVIYYKRNLLSHLMKFKNISDEYHAFLKDTLLMLYDEFYHVVKEVIRVPLPPAKVMESWFQLPLPFVV